MEYVNAFWAGGLICALVQILLDRTKLMPGRVMVLLVTTGTVLGFLGVYDPLIEMVGCGASVPLLGFGNTLFQGVKEAVQKEDPTAFLMVTDVAEVIGRGFSIKSSAATQQAIERVRAQVEMND